MEGQTCEIGNCQKTAIHRCDDVKSTMGCRAFGGCDRLFCVDHAHTFAETHMFSGAQLFYSCSEPDCARKLDKQKGEYWRGRFALLAALLCIILMIVGFTAETVAAAERADIRADL